MGKALMLTALTVLVARAAHAQNLVGDWQGTLKAGGGELRLALHISRSDDGSLKAALDSIDQNANGIPVTAISLHGSELDFTVDSIHGSYQGKVNPAATLIHGTWTQGPTFPLDFSRIAAPPPTASKPAPTPAKPSDIDGVWLGALDAGALKLRVVFHITNTAQGLTATLDSPDQGATGIPVSTVTRNGSSLRLELKQIGGVFEGIINPDRTTIGGTWTQGAGTQPLTLKRVKDAAELEERRPQNPVKPYPYREEEVTYPNKAAGIKLGGTLTLPPGAGPFPAVALVAGSGAHGHDEAVMGHRPFLVLADYLTRHGIAVLRYDKRGVGQSGGDYATATTLDFAADAQAAFEYLQSRPEADPHKIGLIGHSEGGLIVPMVAASDPDVAFIVMLAGPGVPGRQILPEQTLLISEASGVSPEQAEKNAAEERELLALVKSEKDDAALEKQLRQKLSGQVPEAQLGTQIKMIESPWFRYFIQYDPAPTLEKVKCPVLALTGEKDLQAPPQQNLPAIRQALAAGGNKHFEVDELPGLNHLFQTAKTGAPSEYAQIEETMSPDALKKIAGWILER